MKKLMVVWAGAVLPILVASMFSVACGAQTVSPDVLRMHQKEIEQEEMQLRQDELNLIATNEPKSYVEANRNETDYERIMRNLHVRNCAKVLARDVYMSVSRQIGPNASEFLRLASSDPDGARKMLNQTFVEASDSLARLINEILVLNYEAELMMLRDCVGLRENGGRE